MFLLEREFEWFHPQDPRKCVDGYQLLFVAGHFPAVKDLQQKVHFLTVKIRQCEGEFVAFLTLWSQEGG